MLFQEYCVVIQRQEFQAGHRAEEFRLNWKINELVHPKVQLPNRIKLVHMLFYVFRLDPISRKEEDL